MARQGQHKHITYYDILGIPPTATFDEIKQAYRKLAMEWHPDRNRGNQRLANFKLKAINEAYAHLKDARVRTPYDQMLKRQRDKLTPRNDNAGPGLVGQFWKWLFMSDKR